MKVAFKCLQCSMCQGGSYVTSFEPHKLTSNIPILQKWTFKFKDMEKFTSTVRVSV